MGKREHDPIPSMGGCVFTLCLGGIIYLILVALAFMFGKV